MEKLLIDNVRIQYQFPVQQQKNMLMTFKNLVALTFSGDVQKNTPLSQGIYGLLALLAPLMYEFLKNFTSIFRKLKIHWVLLVLWYLSILKSLFIFL